MVIAGEIAVVFSNLYWTLPQSKGKDTKRNLKHKKSELTTKTAGKKSDVEKVTNKKSRVDQIKHEVEEAIKSKIEK